MEKVDLIITDGHKGLQATAERSFPRSSWQIFLQTPEEAAQGDHQLFKKLQDCADELELRGFPREADTIERFIPGLLNYRLVPQDT